MDLGSDVNSSITMLDEILKDGMLLNVLVDIGFKVPVMHVAIVGQGLQHTFSPTGSVINVVGPKEVANEGKLHLRAITGLCEGLQISAAHVILSAECKLVKGLCCC